MKYTIEAVTPEELKNTIHQEFKILRSELIEQLGKELPKMLDKIIDQKIDTKLKNAKITI